MEDIVATVPKSSGVAVPRGPKHLRRQVTHERVMQAGFEILVEQGFSKLSGNAIVERANLSRGALLNLYPTAGALLEALVGHIVSVNSSKLLEDARKTGRGDDDLQSIIHTAWTNMKGPVGVALYELIWGLRSDREMSRKFQPQNAKIQGEVFELFWPAFRKFGVREKDVAEMLFIEMVCTLRGLVSELFLTGDEDKVEKAFNFYCARLLRFGSVSLD